MPVAVVHCSMKSGETEKDELARDVGDVTQVENGVLAVKLA